MSYENISYYYNSSEYSAFACYSRDFQIPAENIVECFLFKLPFFLQDIGMGYISMAFSSLVIGITFFGKIKESYKWFILNQAVWDLFVSYDFICARPSASDWAYPLLQTTDGVNWALSSDTVVQTCFYARPEKLARFFHAIDNYGACYTLFLLSFSRFLALYFHHFYDRHFKSYRTIIIIVIFDILFFFSINIKNTYLLIKIEPDLTSRGLLMIEYIILLLVIPISIMFILLILVKIGKQLKFQFQQQNKATRSASIRIAGVLVFHCVTLIISFALTSVYDLPSTIIPLFKSLLLNQPPSAKPPNAIFLAWKNNQKCFNVIRILIDSIVVLVILSGYRRSIFAIIKLCMPWKKTPIEDSTRNTVSTRNLVNTSRHQ